MGKRVCPSCGTANTSVPFEPTAEDLRCECGSMMVEPWTLKPRKPLRRSSEKKAPETRRRGSTLRRGKGFGASPAQRAKVEGLACVGCGREAGGDWVIDPMHVWPRGKGGCDDPLCVLPGCRHTGTGEGCHRAFDRGELDLLPRLAGSETWAKEQAHPISEHGVGLVELVRRLGGNNTLVIDRRHDG